jgi:hypothetical protein
VPFGAITGADYTNWLTEAGFRAPTISASAGMPSSFVIAERA